MRERERTRRGAPAHHRRGAARGPAPSGALSLFGLTSFLIPRHAQDTRKSARLLTRHGSGAHLTRSRAPSPYITFLPPPSLFFLPLRCSCMLADNRRQGPAWPLQSTSQAPACNQRVSLQLLRPYEPTACQCQSPADFVYFSVAWFSLVSAGMHCHTPVGHTPVTTMHTHQRVLFCVLCRILVVCTICFLQTALCTCI